MSAGGGLSAHERHTSSLSSTRQGTRARDTLDSMKGTNPDQSIEARGRAAREPTILHAVVIAVLTSVLQCLLAMPLAVWCERQLRAGFDTGALAVLADADVLLVPAPPTIFAVPLNYLLARTAQA